MNSLKTPVTQRKWLPGELLKKTNKRDPEGRFRKVSKGIFKIKKNKRSCRKTSKLPELFSKQLSETIKKQISSGNVVLKVGFW